MLLISLLVCGVDILVKYTHWWYSIPHHTDRPTEILAGLLLLCLVMLTIVPRRWMMIGCGLVLGGSISNLIDLEINGMVWDMIPLPDNLYANLADAAIFSGLSIIIVGFVIYVIGLWRDGYFVAPADGQTLN